MGESPPIGARPNPREQTLMPSTVVSTSPPLAASSIHDVEEAAA